MKELFFFRKKPSLKLRELNNQQFINKERCRIFLQYLTIRCRVSQKIKESNAIILAKTIRETLEPYTSNSTEMLTLKDGTQALIFKNSHRVVIFPDKRMFSE